MNTIKILHCADLHIGASEKFLGSLATSRRMETLLTFERIIDKACEEQVDLIAIAGDLFDSNNIESSFIKSVLDKISHIPQIQVIYSAGNHDPLNLDSPFSRTDLPANFHILNSFDDCIDIKKLNVRIYGKSFESTYQTGKNNFSLIPPDDDTINLMVIHGDLKTDLNSNYNSITPDFIKNSKMDYIALGHIHKRTPINKIGNTFFSYSGCPEGQGFDELDEKGVYIGEIGKQYCNMKFVELSKRKHIRFNFDISLMGSSSSICENILSFIASNYGEKYEDNLYYVVLSGFIEQSLIINIPEITSRLSEVLYYIKIKDSTLYKIDNSSIDNEISLKAFFIKNMMKKIKECPESEDELKNSLTIGLRAFNSEVNFNDNQ